MFLDSVRRAMLWVKTALLCYQSINDINQSNQSIYWFTVQTFAREDDSDTQKLSTIVNSIVNTIRQTLIPWPRSSTHFCRQCFTRGLCCFCCSLYTADLDEVAADSGFPSHFYAMQLNACGHFVDRGSSGKAYVAGFMADCWLDEIRYLSLDPHVGPRFGQSLCRIRMPKLSSASLLLNVDRCNSLLAWGPDSWESRRQTSIGVECNSERDLNSRISDHVT